MSLGIGGATPYSQASNHQTAANHQIRDSTPYDHTRQTKVKCTSCGMWAPKSGTCNFCKRPSNGKTENKAPTLKAGVKAKTTVSQNAHTHEHRDVTPYNPQAQVKVKCTSCGMWAKKGANCGFCKRPVPAK